MKDRGGCARICQDETRITPQAEGSGEACRDAAEWEGEWAELAAAEVDEAGDGRAAGGGGVGGDDWADRP